MSIFSLSNSIFKTRRQRVVIEWECVRFYASWPLLRMRAASLIAKPYKRQHHFQRDLYECRQKGALRQGRKNFPKNFKRSMTITRKAFNWYARVMPLH